MFIDCVRSLVEEVVQNLQQNMDALCKQTRQQVQLLRPLIASE